ncbi:hypothetical protein LSAT2_022258 [Lamellibrachia satsuma]|nr:hypothetical protein LSAT2_022258 [Lamellibrachia satsuma]
MTTDKKDANVHLHIRFLYLLITVLCFGFACATWICLTEIRQLRSDLDGEITAVRRGYVVEFDDDVASDGDAAWNEDASGAPGSDPDSNPGEVTIDRMDDLVRVRRGTKQRRVRPSFFVDGSDAKEGSGSGGGDWVWLTSYSRISVGDICNL